MTSRDEDIRKASQDYLKIHFQNDLQAFVDGARWADENPLEPRADYHGSYVSYEEQEEIGRKLTTLEAKLKIAIEALEDLTYFAGAIEALQRIRE